MFPIQQQITAATRSHLDTQLAFFSDFGQTAMESIEKLVQLNIAAARASLEESSAAAVKMLAARDPNELLSIVRAQGGPNFGKAIAYGNHVINIATNAQSEITRSAEAQIAAAGRQASEMVEEAARSAPPGVENMLAVMKSAIGNATNGYEQINKSTRQAAEALESNTNAVVNQIVTPTAPSQG